MIGLKSIIWLISRLLCFPTLVCIIAWLVSFWDTDHDLRWVFGGTTFLFLFLTSTLYKVGKRQSSLQFNTATLAFAIFWLLIVFVSALPFLYLPREFGFPHYSAAFFEAMSGYTSTGLTMVVDPSVLPKSFQIYRSLMQWVGGAGFALFVVTIIDREEHLEPLIAASGIDRAHPGSDMSLLKVYLPIYLGLSVISYIGYRVLDMPGWQALNHALTTVATGGFVITSDSFASYSPEILTFSALILMLSALPLPLAYMACRGRWALCWKNSQFRFYTVWIAAAVGIVAGITQVDIRQLYNTISAATTAGFSASDSFTPDPQLMSIFTVLMIIGGCAASTAGGIKVNRAVWILKGIKLKYLTRNSGWKATFNGKLYPEKKVHRYTLTSAIFLATSLTIRLVVGQILCLYEEHIPVGSMMFDLTSALTTTGLSVGAVSHQMSELSLWVFSMIMFIGRLEYDTIGVLLICCFFRVGRDRKE